MAPLPDTRAVGGAYNPMRANNGALLAPPTASASSSRTKPDAEEEDDEECDAEGEDWSDEEEEAEANSSSKSSGSGDEGALAASSPAPKIITPLPKLVIFVCFWVQITEALNVTTLFPYMAFFVEDMVRRPSTRRTCEGACVHDVRKQD